MNHHALVVIGNFDGVHRGHQAVLATVSRMARDRSLAPRLLTFDPHPAVTLGRPPPATLTTLERKRELVERACPGIEMVVRRFTKEFAAQSPAKFVERVLIADLVARLVLVGDNFRFGKGRAGGIEELRQFGAEHGFDVHSEALVSDEGGRVWSSTRVRQRVAAGDVSGAAEILGRFHMLSGVVTRGDQRGRTIGFPTCNIPSPPEAMPAHGVYAVAVDQVVEGQIRALGLGVANVGVRPTVKPEGEGPVLEAHLFDLEQDLYGAVLRVHLVERLRDEQRFDGLEALKAQIARDAASARERLAGVTPTRSGAYG